MSKRRYLFKILLLSYIVYCDGCVTYDFEKDYGILFNQNSNMCSGRQEWRVGIYRDFDIPSPHESSTKFVYPGESLSCVSSIPYPMSGGGTFEVTVYLDSKIGDEIWVLVNEIVPNGPDAAVGNMWFTESGWQTRRITLTGRGQYQGYITMLGIAAADSTVLVDSFRYIPPNYEGDCNIYEHEITSTTSYTTPGEWSTTPGEWSTTPEITTPGEWSTTPGEWSTTPEITTPGEWSTTPEITTPGEWSTTPEITTPGEWSTTPEITTPGEWSTTPEITTPGEWSTTPGEWSTTPEITTPGEWSTTPGEWSTTQDTTTTEETTTTPAITTTDQLSTTEDFISVETTTTYTTMESKPEDTYPTLNPYEPTQNTEITTESTIPPTSRPVVPDSFSFWNPYTITMVILLILIFIIIVAGVSYYFGLRKGLKKEPIIVSDFIDDLPKSMIIPRVDKIRNNSILTR